MPREPVHDDDAPEPSASSPLADEDIENAAVEALLEQYANEQNVWEYLDTIQHRMRVPPQQRQRFYEQFKALVATRPQAEQDALLTAGQPVFRYRMDTARDDVARLRAHSGDSVKIAPTVIGDDFMADIIHVPTEITSVKYMRYSFADGATEICDRIEINGIVHMPPQTALISKNVLVLPTGADDYGDESVLLRDVWSFLKRYVFIEDKEFLALACYWTLLSWLYDRFDVVPYLRFRGEWGVGKSRALRVVGSLAYRPVFAGGATTASPIFRIIERFQPTLTLDEADFDQHSDLRSEIIKILNMGSERGGAVLRSERRASDDQYDPEAYNVYGPKVLATRLSFGDDALESRCISYTMPATHVPDRIPLILTQEFRDEARALRNKLLMWRFRGFQHVTLNPFERFGGLDLRLNQILLPLMAVAPTVELRDSILRYATFCQRRMSEQRSESWEGRVASAIIEAWRKRTHPERVLMKSLNERVRAQCEEAGLKFSERKVSNMVRGTFGLSTPKIAGMVWIKLDEGDIARLSGHYSVDDSVPPLTEVA